MIHQLLGCVELNAMTKQLASLLKSW